VALTLKLLYLWGAPIAWTFDGEDEQALARMLVELDDCKADRSAKRAVLAAERDGKIVGAWTRDGVRGLASKIVVDSRSSSPWIDVLPALEDATTGPD
jgi:hypothetical protein